MTQQATTLVEYNKEIVPMYRNLKIAKDTLKEFKDSEEAIIAIQDQIKDLQDGIKKLIEEHEEGSAMLLTIKEIEDDIKQAISSAANATKFKKGGLKAFFSAKAKEKAVEKVISKGELFDEFMQQLK